MRKALRKAADGRVTLKTLGAELGLSICTINKALTGKDRISEATRTRVVETAARLGYRPNRLARSLKRPARTIGVVYPQAWESYYGALMAGVRAELAELADHRVVGVWSAVPGFRDGPAYIEAVRRQIADGADGLILALGHYPEEVCRLLWGVVAGSRLPVALLGQDYAEAPRLCVVRHDSQRCGRIAAEILGFFAKGPMAIVIGNLGLHDHRLKVDGFRSGLAADGRGEPLVVEAQDDPDEAFAAVGCLLDAGTSIAGLYVATENLPGVHRALEARGLAGHLSVVATGRAQAVLDLLMRGSLRASIFQREPDQGRSALREICRYLDTGVRPAPEILIPPALILRSTCDLVWEPP